MNETPTPEDDQQKSQCMSGFDSIEKRHSSNYNSNNTPIKFQETSNDIIRRRNINFQNSKIGAIRANSAESVHERTPHFTPRSKPTQEKEKETNSGQQSS